MPERVHDILAWNCDPTNLSLTPCYQFNLIRVK